MIAIDGPFAADEALTLFPLGFIVAREGARLPEALDRWPVQGLGGFGLHTHPDCPCWQRTGPRGAVIVAGHCYGVHGGDREAALSAFAETGDEAVLDRLSGRFVAMFAGPDGLVRLRNDPFGSRTVAIDLQGGSFPAASHPVLLAHALNRGRDPEMATLKSSKDFLRKVPRYLPGNGSLYDGIAHLLPNHDFLPATGQMLRFWPRVSPLGPGPETKRETFLALVGEHFEHLSRAAQSEGWRLVHGATAGQDSRTVLAGLRGSGRIEVCVTWTGSYLKPSEVPVIERVAELTGLPHDLVEPEPLSSSDLPDKTLRAMAVAGAGVRGPSNLTAAMMRHGGPGRVFLRGYGGEILRGFYNRQRHAPKRKGTPLPPLSDDPAVLFPRLYLAAMQHNPQRPLSEGFQGAVASAFNRLIAQSDYSPSALQGLDPLDIFYWEHRMGIWGAMMLNEMDAALPSLVGLNSRPMYEAALRLPRDYRFGRAITKDMISLFDPALAF